MIRKIFFGCNTARGFCSFFNFLKEKDKGRIFILKGGPGHGKSTIIKSVADEMINKGYDVELQFCSLDCNSLDAAVIHSLNLAVAATTGHHVMDPEFPGVVESIVNLDRCLQASNLFCYKNDIIFLFKSVRRNLKRACRYLKAAKLMAENIRDVTCTYQSLLEINKVVKELKRNILVSSSNSKKLGLKRHVFASAFTPEGYKTFIKTLVKGYTIYKIIGNEYCITKILKKIGEEAVLNRFNIEYCHHPLDPYNIEHLIFPDLNLAIISNTDIPDKKCEEVYNINNGPLQMPEEKKMEELIEYAIKNFRRAYKYHRKLEEYYVKNMKFNCVEKILERLIQEINEWESFIKKG